MMKKIMNIKVTSIIACLLAIILVCSTANAAEIYSVQNKKLQGVSFVEPKDNSEGNIGIKRLDPPSKVWDISKKGQYDFSGVSTGPNLYTNYKFKGKTSYTVYLKNTGKNKITIKAKTLTKTYAQTTIGAGKSGSFDLSGMDKKKGFYIVFDAGGKEYEFNGYIK